MTKPGVAIEKSWFEALKQKLNVDGIIEKMNLSRDRLIEMGIYLAIGFLAGFLFKKYARYLFIVVLTVAVIAFLHHFEFIKVTIFWDKIQGLQPVPVPVGADMWTELWQWIKANFAVVLSFVAGFFVGFKVG